MYIVNRKPFFEVIYDFLNILKPTFYGRDSEIKINIAKNPKLVNALRVKVIPTLMIYKLGEMVWRQSGEQDANTLIALMNEYVN